MKRALLVGLLAFGTVAGFWSGIHHLRHHACGARAEWGHHWCGTPGGWQGPSAACDCRGARPAAPVKPPEPPREAVPGASP